MRNEPRFSVCQLTLAETTFEEDVEMCRRLGIEGLGINAGKLTVGEEGRLHELMLQNGVKASLCVPAPMSLFPLPDIPGPNDPAERLASIKRDIARMAPLDPATIFVVTGPSATYEGSDARAYVVEALRELVDFSGQLGVKLSVEPMRESFRETWSIIGNLDETIELIDEAGGGIGVMYDIWHMWSWPDALADTEKYADRIMGVHVADERDPTRSRADRVLPGDGVADITGVLQALQRGGFDGWYDLEVFSAGYPDSITNDPASKWVAAGKEGFERLLAQSLDSAQDR